MPGINFMNRNDVGGVIIERGQPFLFLFFWPVALRWRDIIIGFGRFFFERARRVHGGERGGATVLRRLGHARSHFRRDRHQMMSGDEFSDFLEVFPDVRKQVLRGWMLALNLFEDFSGQFAWVDFFRGLRERLLLLL